MNPLLQDYIVPYLPIDDWQASLSIKKKYGNVLNKLFCGMVRVNVTGAFVRKSHPGILSMKQTDYLLKGKVSSGLRDSIAKYQLFSGCYFCRNIEFSEDLLFGYGEGMQLQVFNDDGELTQPYLLSIEEWKQVAKNVYGQEWNDANWPKRRRLILNTIRHTMGYYDRYIEKFGIDEACRLFMKYVCKHYPELKSGLDEFISKKECSGVSIPDVLSPVVVAEPSQEKHDAFIKIAQVLASEQNKAKSFSPAV